MGLFGSLIGEPLRTVVLLSSPTRAAMLDHLADTLSERTGADREKAATAVRMAVQDGEATLLDTPDGCAVILQDATELVGFLR